MRLFAMVALSLVVFLVIGLVRGNWSLNAVRGDVAAGLGATHDWCLVSCNTVVS